MQLLAPQKTSASSKEMPQANKTKRTTICNLPRRSNRAVLSTVWDVPVREGWLVARGERFSHCVTGEFVGHFSIGRRNWGLIFRRQTPDCQQGGSHSRKVRYTNLQRKTQPEAAIRMVWRRQRQRGSSATRLPSKASDSTQVCEADG